MITNRGKSVILLFLLCQLHRNLCIERQIQNHIFRGDKRRVLQVAAHAIPIILIFMLAFFQGDSQLARSVLGEESRRQIISISGGQLRIDLELLAIRAVVIGCQFLQAEGKDPASIYVTGNTAIDALKTTVREDYTFKDETLKNTVDILKKKINPQ